jgi:hypothetical protein
MPRPFDLLSLSKFQSWPEGLSTAFVSSRFGHLTHGTGPREGSEQSVVEGLLLERSQLDQIDAVDVSDDRSLRVTFSSTRAVLDLARTVGVPDVDAELFLPGSVSEHPDGLLWTMGSARVILSSVTRRRLLPPPTSELRGPGEVERAEVIKASVKHGLRDDDGVGSWILRRLFAFKGPMPRKHRNSVSYWPRQTVSPFSGTRPNSLGHRLDVVQRSPGDWTVDDALFLAQALPSPDSPVQTRRPVWPAGAPSESEAHMLVNGVHVYITSSVLEVATPSQSKLLEAHDDWTPGRAGHAATRWRIARNGVTRPTLWPSDDD